jgi:hypothetical protein
MDTGSGLMLKPVFGEHGSLQSLYLDGQQIIRPWGIETADACAFFSLETGGWGNQILVREMTCSDTRLDGLVTVRMAEGLWAATLADIVSGRSIERQLRYLALEDTWAMDVVMRFVFPRFVVHQAEIADQRIAWDGTNYYHQYATNQVLLYLDKYKLRIRLTDSYYPSDWRLYMYVRCSPREDAWIVHIRLLPAIWKREVIKHRCIGSHHIVFPELLSRQVLKIPGVAQHLRYAGERNRLLGSRVNVYPLVLIPKGTVITLQARVDILL